jgi:hypothetical protein
VAIRLCDGEGQNRTGDTTIFSRVLYQLSYLAGRAKASVRAISRSVLAILALRSRYPS